MPIATIAQALPYVNWILLVALGVGSLAFAALAREWAGATGGYVGFTVVCAALLAGLALLADFGLPAPTELVVVEAAPELELLRRIGLVAFIALALGYVLALRRGRRTVATAVAAAVAGGLTMAAAAVGWAPSLADAVPLGVQLAVLSAAAGGALATLVLGHWYLVTPRLSEKPLVLLTRLLTLVIVLQLALFVIWSTLGGGPGQDPFEAFAGETMLFVLLRLTVTLGFSLVLAWMAWRTALTRSMESATGLLYIGLAAILAGTIGAAALYVSAGVLV